MYYFHVVDVLQLSKDQSIMSMLCLLTGWALQAVLDLHFSFWWSETDEGVMSLGQYLNIIEKRPSIGSEENCDRTDSSRNRGRKIMEKKY